MRPSVFIRRATKAAVLPLGFGGRARPGDVVILLYHRVGVGAREIDLELPAFERQIAYLAQLPNVRTLDAAMQEGGTGGVVITVDDGYSDFYDHLVPVLVKHRIPALLYLATGLVADGKRSLREDRDLLTWSQLREALSTGLVTVGAHTHSHADLSRASERTAQEEMLRSKELVEDRLSVACRHFAYPWGVASAAAERVAHRLFDTAVLGWRTNRRGRIDAHRLGRTPVLRSDGQAFFVAKVNGILDGEALVYRLLRRGPWRPS